MWPKLTYGVKIRKRQSERESKQQEDSPLAPTLCRPLQYAARYTLYQARMAPRPQNAAIEIHASIL
jgi:hypothetical protein